MAKAYFYFNQRYSNDYGIKILNKTAIPVPRQRIKTLAIPGRDGFLYEEEGYDDVTLSFDVEVTDKDEIKESYRNIKEWLRNVRDNRFYIFNDPDFFYRVNQVEVDDIQNAYKNIGLFKVSFICEPFRYFKGGESWLSLPKEFYNHYEVCPPIYTVTGNGNCVLKVNNKQVSLAVNGNITVDTKNFVCYKSGNVLANADMAGEFTDLYLQKGKNTFSISPSFTCKILMNLRSL